MASFEATTQVAEDRLRELLEVVLERNPFQRRRLESLDLGSRPSLAELRVVDQRSASWTGP